MNLADDCELTYTINHESWHYEINRLSGLHDEGNGRSLGIQSSHAEGGVDWEFTIVEYTFDKATAVQVRMFDDSFAAWSEVPEFFTRLHPDQPADLDAVRGILDDIGARDTTERVNRNQLIRRYEQARDALHAYDAAAPIPEDPNR